MLILDNELQFDNKAFKRYCCKLGIRNRYSTQAYLQGNGQAKAVNKVIISGLKKRLDEAKGRRVKELPHVLWTIGRLLVSQLGKHFFHDVWVRGSDPSRDWISNIKDQLVHP